MAGNNMIDIEPNDDAGETNDMEMYEGYDVDIVDDAPMDTEAALEWFDDY